MVPIICTLLQEGLQSGEVGSPGWWSRLKKHRIPLITPARDGYDWVSFFWQDPQGDERHSKTRRVWINITGITDHHQGEAPVSLQRIPHTDVWVLEKQFSASWRGSYMLLPSHDSDDFQGDVNDIDALRSWWKHMFPKASADPLNPDRTWIGARGVPASPLAMPKAPPQSAWQAVDQGQQTLQHGKLTLHSWCSQMLGNTRKVRTLSFGKADIKRPLAIVLDGEFWTRQMPLPIALEALTQQHRLPPAVYLFIDSVDKQQRAQELPCNPQFWEAVTSELRPKLSEWAPCSPAPQTTIIAGQSFGGLAAAFAILSKPRLASNAICQSSSFWWPARHNVPPDSFMIKSLQQGQFCRESRQFFIEAGTRERLIHAANEQVISLLKQAGHRVTHRSVDGGHDALCWRGGLTDGLQVLWSKNGVEN
jgi:enterochelin esterase family protein